MCLCVCGCLCSVSALLFRLAALWAGTWWYGEESDSFGNFPEASSSYTYSNRRSGNLSITDKHDNVKYKIKNKISKLNWTHSKCNSIHTIPVNINLLHQHHVIEGRHWTLDYSRDTESAISAFWMAFSEKHLHHVRRFAALVFPALLCNRGESVMPVLNIQHCGKRNYILDLCLEFAV